jgi:hypothetical protein
VIISGHGEAVTIGGIERLVNAPGKENRSPTRQKWWTLPDLPLKVV